MDPARALTRLLRSRRGRRPQASLPRRRRPGVALLESSHATLAILGALARLHSTGYKAEELAMATSEALGTMVSVLENDPTPEQVAAWMHASTSTLLDLLHNADVAKRP